MRARGLPPIHALLAIVACACLWTSCGESPTAPSGPSPIDPEAILYEEMSRQGLGPSWYRGCIWENFLLHLPTYQGKSLAFIIADIRAIIAACLEDDGEPDNGALEVTTSTSGDDLDAGGFTLSIDSGTPEPIGTNAVVTVEDLAPGDHEVLLGDVAANCTVDGDNPRTVSVPSGATAQTTFTITCEALPPTVGALDVVTSTSGSDVDSDGYMVSVGGGPGALTGVNDTLNLVALTPGNYEVELSGVTANCSVGGENPRTVAVAAGVTTETTFSVTCAETEGTLDVVTSTGGTDIDADGYTVSVGGGSAVATGVSDTLSFPDLTPGDHEVLLDDVAANCTVGGENPRTVAVSAGTTAETTFTVTCTAIIPPPDEIVFSRAGSGLWIIADDGANETQLTTDGTDEFPDVSPDGGTLVFASGSESDIFTAAIDGSNRDQLTDASTAGGESFDPEFSPDGSRIVFFSNRGGSFQIWVMDADGSNPVGLTTSGNNAFPSWSPDGTRIVFASTRNGNFEIYVMDDDGANQTRLTNNSAADLDPAFSPDGAQIVFDTDRNGPGNDIYVMDDDGTDQVQLTTDTGEDFYPAWSPDGLFIAFSSNRSGTTTIWVMGADGSNQTELSSLGLDFTATWAP